MKKLTIFALVICLVLCLTACGGGDELPVSGTYVVDAGYDTSEGMPPLKPFITLDAEEGRFVFTFDPLSSYLPVGSYTVADGVLTATTDDGQYTYIFEVVDEGTLEFRVDGSSEISYMSDSIGIYPITDGTKFVSTTAAE